MVTFIDKEGKLGRATSKANDAKWKMKHRSNMTKQRFELRLFRFVANHATSYPIDGPVYNG